MVAEASMFIVHVHVCVRADRIEQFKAATVENASQSVLEPGVARFDFLQDAEEPARFVLVEAYRNSEAAAAHKQTSHYLKWRDTVAEMMAEPRRGVKYSNLFPHDAGWD